MLEDLQHIDPDLLKKYQTQIDLYSTGRSSSHPRRIGEGTRIRQRLQSSIWISN